ncbi:hypothetical protein NDU88_001484 [Pleurodeles waltl]|uniref:Uncharacterized protein n=1 Tax=Pleurodeles waltl TaxID=8319 RepID=A0AAV7P5X2_PLEWA|nr:hypothetical protein NDU88_001484 [Pleurodeles waltl]
MMEHLNSGTQPERLLPLTPLLSDQQAVDPENHPNSPTSVEGKRDAVLASIEQSSVSLENKIFLVAIDFRLLRDDHQKLSDKVHIAEQSLATFQMQTHDMQSQLHTLSERAHTLVEYAEGRSRQNIRMMGLPENAECWDVRSYLESWICSFIPAESL